MDIENYELGYEIEGSLKEEYKKNLEELNRENNSKGCLDKICSMFEVLGKSHPDEGKGLSWARDMIEAYRNTADILEEFKESSEKNSVINENLERDLENFEGNF